MNQFGYCSWHYHQQRANAFKVLSGIIDVAVLYGPRLEVHRLSADMVLRVPSLVVHQFRVVESGVMIEEYVADRGGDVREDDIVRLMEGGTVDCCSEFDTLAQRLHELYWPRD